VESTAVEGRLAGKAKGYVRRNGQHMLLPAGADSIWTSAPRQSRDETLCFCYPATWLDEAAVTHGLRPGASALAPRFEQRDPVLWHLATHAAKLREEGSGGAEAFEHIAVIAALRLLGEPPAAETPVGALAPKRLHRVLEHIEAHLEEALRLEDLAATAGLSMFHFARAFRQSMGVAPHAHIRARRVARAQEMLRGREAALADIALACGFADQSHFTTAFRRATGTTPRRWRAGQH
jgi:AraC-like DNA-binding protein